MANNHLVLVSSLPGIHQNSNLMTGGGNDDTAVIQAALSASYPDGLLLVQDGVSLVSGLNVGANTTIQCETNCGFYLANGSNREILRNVNRSATVITDTNITITGGFYNGNKANQSGVLQADNTPMNGFGFYGISNLTIKSLEVYDSSCWEIGIGNFSNVLVNNCSLIATATTSNLNTDGVDLRGPGTNATLSNLTILAGDDSIALNSRNYGPGVTGPYIGGGNISDVTIENIVMDGSLFGIDLISDGTFEVSDVTISNLSGTVQNYALYLNLDVFNTPAGDGNFQNITLDGSSVTQVGSPFGDGIPPGLYVVGGVTSGIQFSGVSPLPQSINLSASASKVTGLQIGTGTPFNANGEMLVNFQGLSFVQSAVGGSALATSDATFGNPCTEGSWILVYVLCFPEADTLTGIGDGVNTYSFLTDGSTGSSECYLYQVKQNTSNTALTITPTFETTPGTLAIVALEYVGQPPNPVDAVSALLTETTTAYTANSVTTTGLNETVIGLGFYTGGSTFTAVSPAVLRNFSAFNSGAEDLLATTPGTYSPKATSDSETYAWFTAAAFGQTPQAAAPIFVPDGGTFTGSVTVTISSATGGTIYYTTDGTTPTHASSSILSGGSVTISSSVTLKALASLAGYSDSQVTVASFTNSTSVYSVPDCRNYATFPNNSVDVNGTLTYTMPSVLSHSLPVDSRVKKPVSSAENYPQNCRTDPPF